MYLFSKEQTVIYLNYVKKKLIKYNKYNKYLSPMKLSNFILIFKKKIFMIMKY